MMTSMRQTPFWERDVDDAQSVNPESANPSAVNNGVRVLCPQCRSSNLSRRNICAFCGTMMLAIRCKKCFKPLEYGSIYDDPRERRHWFCHGCIFVRCDENYLNQSKEIISVINYVKNKDAIRLQQKKYVEKKRSIALEILKKTQTRQRLLIERKRQQALARLKISQSRKVTERKLALAVKNSVSKQPMSIVATVYRTNDAYCDDKEFLDLVLDLENAIQAGDANVVDKFSQTPEDCLNIDTSSHNVIAEATNEIMVKEIVKIVANSNIGRPIRRSARIQRKRKS